MKALIIVLVVSVGMHFGLAAAAEANSPLVGTWRLVSYTDTPQSGEPIHAFGIHPIGQFIFTADGHVSISIMRNPPDTDAPSIDRNPDACFPAWYCAYFGTYKVDYGLNTWVTHVLGGNIPSYIGTDQPRKFILRKNQLIINDTYQESGKTVRAERVLVREGSAERADPRQLPTQSEWLAIVQERLAGLKGDKATWRRHISEGCVWVGPAAKVARFPEVLAQQVDAGIQGEILDLSVDDHGDSVVLTYILREQVPQEGGAKIVRLRRMDTYTRLSGDWRLISVAELVVNPDRKRAQLDPRLLDEYTGIYENVLHGKKLRTRIWRDGSKLMSQTEGQEPEELIPESNTVFFQASTPEEGSPDNLFVRDAKGHTIAWIYKDAGVEFRADKVR